MSDYPLFVLNCPEYEKPERPNLTLTLSMAERVEARAMRPE